jgi:hypothetical protein
MKDSPLETTGMDFTPSEIDDLETIELPSSEQPKNIWTVGEEAIPPYFPGQRLDLTKRAEKARRHKAPPLSSKESPPSGWPLRLFPLFHPPSPKEYEDASLEKHEGTL